MLFIRILKPTAAAAAAFLVPYFLLFIGICCFFFAQRPREKVSNALVIAFYLK
jgi:hypothetical protein